MKGLLFAGVIALVTSPAFAQTPDPLATTTGQEVNVNLSHYNYVEPTPLKISIHGAKVGGEYTGTWSLGPRRHWFAQANFRGTIGSAAYDGFCLPWLIVPDSASPNGYALDLGDASPCSESGDRDWYIETRAVVGKDFIGQTWAVSPYVGLGVRHLSNGTTGIVGFRKDTYLYPPIGVTVRTRMGARALSVNVEYDRLIRGWQKTSESKLGSGTVPATSTAPAFTIDGFTDLSFDQHRGWALRASAKYQATRRWSVEPYYVYWRVGSSPVSHLTVTYTVNGITAHEQLGAYEPFNTTNEFGVKLGFRF